MVWFLFASLGGRFSDRFIETGFTAVDIVKRYLVRVPLRICVTPLKGISVDTFLRQFDEFIAETARKNFGAGPSMAVCGQPCRVPGAHLRPDDRRRPAGRAGDRLYAQHVYVGRRNFEIYCWNKKQRNNKTFSKILE